MPYEFKTSYLGKFFSFWLIWLKSLTDRFKWQHNNDLALQMDQSWLITTDSPLASPIDNNIMPKLSN